MKRTHIRLAFVSNVVSATSPIIHNLQ